MERALYGPAGFFRRERPADHFRTSVHASPLFAGAVAELLARVDAALGRPARLDFVDMAAGAGELAAGVLAALAPGLAARVRVHAVERSPRPPGLDPRVTWTADPPRHTHGLLFANEWLDNVPLPVASPAPDGHPHYVEVRLADGGERLGRRVEAADALWLERWWPSGAGTGADGRPAADLPPGPPGTGLPDARRAEIGRTREAAWQRTLATLDAGLAVAVDYGHTAGARPPFGTLTGYRGGRQAAPVPDGSMDLTAHVAMDTLPGTLTTQREALHALGVQGHRPPLALAARDASAYVRALAAATEAAELTARGALGDFLWLATPVSASCADLLAPRSRG
nr:SAM-dependent methyltransferase [Actinacidiphila yanglinensis]